MGAIVRWQTDNFRSILLVWSFLVVCVSIFGSMDHRIRVVRIITEVYFSIVVSVVLEVALVDS